MSTTVVPVKSPVHLPVFTTPKRNVMYLTPILNTIFMTAAWTNVPVSCCIAITFQCNIVSSVFDCNQPYAEFF